MLKNFSYKITFIIRTIRSWIYRKRVKSCGKGVSFLTGVKLRCAKKITIGSNVRIGENACLAARGGIEIGNNVSIAQDVLIWTDNHNYFSPGLIPYDSKHIEKPVIIKDNVWICSRAMIVPGVTIEEGAVIGMGAVVASNVPACAVVAGNPAKIIKYRDIEKYKELKQKKQFFKI